MCFKRSGVNLLPSSDQAAMDGLNTRFDIYANSFNSCLLYIPDQNVRKGYTAPGNANWCSAVQSGSSWPIADADAAALPPDENMLVVSQDGSPAVDRNVATGNGTWNCADYWNLAHLVGPGRDSPPPGCTDRATISRYSVYQYELNFLGDRSRGGEYGGPECSPPGVAGRRIIYVPIINCGSSPVPVRGSAGNVPVAAFGKFFLTLPANEKNDWSPYAEFMGLIKPSDKLSYDVVQLYR